MKLRILFLILFLACSIAFAEMTIFFKDGSSLNVTKIVFKQNVAELFLLNGQTRTVEADKIDLKASGIPKAEGSYGQAGLSSNRREKLTATPPLIGDAKQRQNALKEEWDKAELSAEALKTIGDIRQGDVVRIANRGSSSSTTPTPTPTAEEYLEGIQDGSFQEGSFPQDDQPFLVIFKRADGTYGKKLFDSATFHSNFSINEKVAEPPPAYVKIPEGEAKVPGQTETPVTTEPSPAIEPPVTEETKTKIPDAEEKESEARVETPGFPVAPILIGAGAIALAGGALFVYSKKRQKPFLNTSQFKQYENELRDFELEIWLKHGRTTDQLVEICLKKFYHDQPSALAAAMKIQKGADRFTVIQSIARQGGLPVNSAEDIYLEMSQRIHWIRELIRQVSEKVGKQPLVQPENQPPAPARAVTSKPVPPTPPQPSIKSKQVTTTGLPAYLRNALKDLGGLSD
jgi:hypothetical protein